MRKVLGLISIVAIVCLLSGCTSSLVNSPNFQITSQSSRSELEGADYVGYVDLVIKNTGGDGAKTIQVKAEQGSSYWTNEQSLYLKNQESQSITFRFPEIQFWTNSSQWYYTVNIV